MAFVTVWMLLVLVAVAGPFVRVQVPRLLGRLHAALQTPRTAAQTSNSGTSRNSAATSSACRSRRGSSARARPARTADARLKPLSTAGG